MVTAVTYYYRVGGGATAVEAACLMRVAGRGMHAVNQAFDRMSPAQTRAAIVCVGSEARMHAMATSLATWFGNHPNG